MANNHLSSKKKAAFLKFTLLATEDPFLMYEFYDLLKNLIHQIDLTDKPRMILGQIFFNFIYNSKENVP